MTIYNLRSILNNTEHLKIDEAKKLYQKYLTSSDETFKKELLDKIIIGTLYVVVNYVDRNNIMLLSSLAYDIDDILSSFVEIWIRKIKNGKLLKVDNFSQILNNSFLIEAYCSMLGTDYQLNEMYGFNVKEFAELFSVFLKLKNNGLNNSTFIDYLNNQQKNSFLKNGSSYVLTYFETIYRNLNITSEDEVMLSETKIITIIKVLIDILYHHSESVELLIDNDMENMLIENMHFESFINDIDRAMKTEREKDILHKRYGLDDGIYHSLKETGKLHNISSTRVRQIECKCLRRLRRPTYNIKKYI